MVSGQSPEDTHSQAEPGNEGATGSAYDSGAVAEQKSEKPFIGMEYQLHGETQ